MTKTKIERLMAIKEEYARTQAALVNARKLEESAQATGMATLLENDLEQAELVLAAQDMMSKLQGMAEDLAKMNAQDLFPLVDKMKAAFGPEAAHAFEGSVQESITNAMNTVRHAKDEMGNSILRLEGKAPQNDMGADAGAGMAPQGDSLDPMAGGQADAGQVDMAMDDFGGSDAASGPEEEPLGRARKESVEGGKALNESALLEAAGQRLIETEGLGSLISWLLNEAAAGMPEEHFRSFATSVAKKAAENPKGLAGWIGQKKHGKAHIAQLAAPTNTATPDLSVVENVFESEEEEDENEKVEEGKSFKHSDDDDSNWDKKSKDKARSAARKEKQKGDDLEEGKTFRKGDDEDDDKADRMKSRSAARKAKGKGDEKIDETTMVAHALAQLIEANIKKTGKGNAAKAVKESVDYLNAHLGLTESEGGHELNLLNVFESVFGMKPAAYSVSKLKELAPTGTVGTGAPKPNAPKMSTQDQKVASSALGKMAGQMGADKTAGSKSVQSAMAGMDGQQRTVANKMLNTMKQNGQNPKNAGEFAAAASGMVDGDDAVNENINAAHWPVDSMGQYKGEPFQTDYGKLKPNPKTAAKTEGGAKETKVEEPKVDGAKAPEGGKPWEKKSEKKAEPKAEEPKEEADDSDDSEK